MPVVRTGRSSARLHAGSPAVTGYMNSRRDSNPHDRVETPHCETDLDRTRQALASPSCHPGKGDRFRGPSSEYARPREIAGASDRSERDRLAYPVSASEHLQSAIGPEWEVAPCSRENEPRDHGKRSGRRLITFRLAMNQLRGRNERSRNLYGSSCQYCRRMEALHKLRARRASQRIEFSDL